MKYKRDNRREHLLKSGICVYGVCNRDQRGYTKCLPFGLKFNSIALVWEGAFVERTLFTTSLQYIYFIHVQKVFAVCFHANAPMRTYFVFIIHLFIRYLFCLWFFFAIYPCYSICDHSHSICQSTITTQNEKLMKFCLHLV